MKLAAFGALFITVFAQHAAGSTFWNAVKGLPDDTRLAEHSRVYTLDIASFKQHAKNHTLTVTVPTPNGTMMTFRLYENNLLPPTIRQKYPNLRTYDGISTDGSGRVGKFSFANNRFNAMFQAEDKWVFIDPTSPATKNNEYHVYYKVALPRSFSDIVKPAHLYRQSKVTESRLAIGNTTEIRHFRLAVSTTGEYTEFHGGKDNAVAEVAVAINRVNQIYNRDLAVNLMLVDNYDQLIFDDPDTDPFNNDVEDGELNIDVTNNAIGSDSYDIGHVFTTAGGGLASLAAVCTSFKADGMTGLSSPTNDAFYVDYVAHELGHQFGANHSFNATSGGCDGNRSPAWAYEPGSGVTIMSYAALCGEEDLEDNFPNASTYDYFHISSIVQIRDTLQSATCGTSTQTANNVPLADAGDDYTLPANTPFELVGEASDADGDPLLYSWEQYDLGTQSASATEVSTDNGSRPIIRNYPLSNSPNRVVPRLDNLLTGTTTFGEILPTTDRRLTFRFVVRDGQGGLAFDETQLIVVDTGSAFAITSPHSGVFEAQTDGTVLWDVAGTNLDPINCPSVDIMLSEDGGNTFTSALLSSVPNNGSADVTWPDINSESIRLKVACNNNLFFAISNANLTITSETAVAPVISGQANLSVNEDTNFTITQQDLTFSAGDTQDISLTIAEGDNYTVEGNTVTPASNFNGELTLSVTATNSVGSSAPFALSATILPVNDRPTIDAVPTDLSITNEQTLTLSLDDITYTDVDNDTVTLSILAGDNYSFNQLTITPNSGFTGTLTVNIQLSDGELTASGTISIAVSDAAQPPPPPPPTPSGSNGGGGSTSIWLLGLLLVHTVVRRAGRTTP